MSDSPYAEYAVQSHHVALRPKWPITERIYDILDTCCADFKHSLLRCMPLTAYTEPCNALSQCLIMLFTCPRMKSYAFTTPCCSAQHYTFLSADSCMLWSVLNSWALSAGTPASGQQVGRDRARVAGHAQPAAYDAGNELRQCSVHYVGLHPLLAV